MFGSRATRLLLLTIALGIAVAGIMLSVFYAQYRSLANQIVATSSAEYRQHLQNDYEAGAQSQMLTAAQSLSEAIAADRDPAAALNTLRIQNENIIGFRFQRTDGSFVDSGNYPTGVIAGSTTWMTDRLVVGQPVSLPDNNSGILSGVFDISELQEANNDFASQLLLAENQNRRLSYVWAGIGTLAALLLCGVVVWLVMRGQTRRIRQLKLQAEKLRDADFGEPLPESRHDELGALAAVFNDMRHELRTTTHSRDYVDSILAGMNEAVIVTDGEGQIERINTATTHLLGYEEAELIGMNIDYVVNTNKSRSLADDTPSGLPKEATFESKFGESIPVSYTCSVVETGEQGSGCRIYAAQNITERRRAEKRIRYLARIDPLTKIPNRMQFQHLLQRGIARARRANKCLALFYIDVDHFKEINDTFGHLAGDTTLETVADRLRAALPKNSIIGRLAGDEFAVIVNDLRPDEGGIARNRANWPRLCSTASPIRFLCKGTKCS